MRVTKKYVCVWVAKTTEVTRNVKSNVLAAATTDGGQGCC